jgi:hypothetical protein
MMMLDHRHEEEDEMVMDEYSQHQQYQEYQDDGELPEQKKHHFEILKRTSMDPTETTTANLSLSEYEFMDFSNHNDDNDTDDWRHDIDAAIGLGVDYHVDNDDENNGDVTILPNVLLMEQDDFLQEAERLLLEECKNATTSSIATLGKDTASNNNNNYISNTETNDDKDSCSNFATNSKFTASLQELLEQRRIQLAASMQASKKTRKSLEPHIKQRASLASVLIDIEKSSRKLQKHLLLQSSDNDSKLSIAEAADMITTTPTTATTSQLESSHDDHDKSNSNNKTDVKSASVTSVAALDVVVEGSREEENGDDE